MLQSMGWQRIGHDLEIEQQRCTHQVYVKTVETKIISNREKKSRRHFTYAIMMHSHKQTQRNTKTQDSHKLQKLIIIKKICTKSFVAKPYFFQDFQTASFFPDISHS